MFKHRQWGSTDLQDETLSSVEMAESGEVRGEAGRGEQQLGLLQRGHVVLQRQGGVGLAGPHCAPQGLYLQSSPV